MPGLEPLTQRVTSYRDVSDGVQSLSKLLDHFFLTVVDDSTIDIISYLPAPLKCYLRKKKSQEQFTELRDLGIFINEDLLNNSRPVLVCRWLSKCYLLKMHL